MGFQKPGELVLATRTPGKTGCKNLMKLVCYLMKARLSEPALRVVDFYGSETARDYGTARIVRGAKPTPPEEKNKASITGNRKTIVAGLLLREKTGKEKQ